MFSSCVFFRGFACRVKTLSSTETCKYFRVLRLHVLKLGCLSFFPFHLWLYLVLNRLRAVFPLPQIRSVKTKWTATAVRVDASTATFWTGQARLKTLRWIRAIWINNNNYYYLTKIFLFFQGSKLKIKSSRFWWLRTRNLVANSQVLVANLICPASLTTSLILN